MEDWQQWQIRASEIAAELGREIDALEERYFGESPPASFRGFWPRFRELKERVRTAPAIKLEDKLELERRLRGLGSKAYKSQEVLFAQSSEQKDRLLETIQAIRVAAEGAETPRALRDLRRDLDALRKEFEGNPTLMPPDRQAVWNAWREANQLVWQRLTSQWGENEAYLRDILGNGQRQLEEGRPNGARQAVGRFFESLRNHEAKQDVVNQLKAEAETLRREADTFEHRRAAERATAQRVPAVSPVEGWRAEYDKNREQVGRLVEDVADLERRYQESDSILEQAMLRGTLVEKRRKLSELERVNRTLEQRIEQAEEAPVISAG